MSAEGRKKRGESGKSNAENIAFRNGGRPSNLSVKTGATTHPRLAGAALLHTVELAQFLPGYNPSDRMERAMDEVIDHLAARHGNTRYGKDWRVYQ